MARAGGLSRGVACPQALDAGLSMQHLRLEYGKASHMPVVLVIIVIRAGRSDGALRRQYLWANGGAGGSVAHAPRLRLVLLFDSREERSMQRWCVPMLADLCRPTSDDKGPPRDEHRTL